MALHPLTVAEDARDQNLPAQQIAQEHRGDGALAARGIVRRPLVRIVRGVAAPGHLDRALELAQGEGGDGCCRSGARLDRASAAEARAPCRRLDPLDREAAAAVEADGVLVGLRDEAPRGDSARDSVDERPAAALPASLGCHGDRAQGNVARRTPFHPRTRHERAALLPADQYPFSGAVAGGGAIDGRRRAVRAGEERTHDGLVLAPAEIDEGHAAILPGPGPRSSLRAG